METDGQHAVHKSRSPHDLCRSPGRLWREMPIITFPAKRLLGVLVASSMEPIYRQGLPPVAGFKRREGSCPEPRFRREEESNRGIRVEVKVAEGPRSWLKGGGSQIL